MDLTTARIVLISDAFFAYVMGIKIQIVYVMFLVDKPQNCNILHYGSNKSQIIAESVVATEGQEFMQGFDFALVIRAMLEETIGPKMEKESLIDSKTVFDVVLKDEKTTDLRVTN